jgi:hypothetical protein
MQKVVLTLDCPIELQATIINAVTELVKSRKNGCVGIDHTDYAVSGAHINVKDKNLIVCAAGGFSEIVHPVKDTLNLTVMAR